MDAETKAYFDGMFAEILAAMNAGFSRLERRPEVVEHRPEAPVKASLPGVTTGGRIAEPETGPEARLERVEERLCRIETRIGRVEARLSDLGGRVAAVNGQVNNLAAEVRQRLRLLS